MDGMFVLREIGPAEEDVWWFEQAVGERNQDKEWVVEEEGAMRRLGACLEIAFA